MAQSTIELKFLFRAKRTVSAFWKVAQTEWTDRDADEAKNFNPERVKHAADLAVLAFFEIDFDPGVFFARAKKGGALGLEDVSLWDFDAVLQSLQQPRVGHNADLNMVGLDEMRGGIRDARGPRGIVGEQEQTFAGFVEASDGSDP